MLYEHTLVGWLPSWHCQGTNINQQLCLLGRTFLKPPGGMARALTSGIVWLELHGTSRMHEDAILGLPDLPILSWWACQSAHVDYDLVPFSYVSVSGPRIFLQRKPKYVAPII